MSHHNANDNEIRSAAQSLYDNIGSINYRGGYHHSGFDYSRPHSINLITEEFLGGYMQDGRMSVVRRFFCLFVTFDLFFVSLLWLICIMITGDNIYNALLTQVVHYSVYKSLFDVVMAAICRFVTLLLFYAFLSVNHWLIIALSTSGSCLFLISKVFVFDWLASPQPVFQVVLILTSFVLAFGEAWFFDCRVIPQERHARSYFTAITSMQTANERSPLLAPFLASEGERPGTESIANFYSPFETNHHSDEEEEQDDEYRKMGIECVRKAYDLLQTDDWKIEKVTKKGDTIQSVQRDKLGKVYRLTGRVKYAAKPLLEELFYKIEEVPKWNPTLLESKIVRKIDSKTDISYQATVGSGGGLVKARDFVNLRSWRLCKNGKIIVDSDDEDESDCKIDEDDDSCVGSVSTISTDNDFLSSDDAIARSINSAKVSHTEGFKTLSKSLGAKDFQSHIVNSHPPSLVYGDANTLPEMSTNKLLKKIDRMYVSAAISVEYPSVPINPKYTRGQNLVSCWALREIDGQKDACIFEWLLCLDLKGYIPKYVLDNSYTTVMQDYMTYLRKYCNEMRQKRKRSSTKQQ